MSIEVITLLAVLAPLLIAAIGLLIKVYRALAKLRADIEAAPRLYASRDDFLEAQSDIQAHGLVLTRHEGEISNAKSDIWGEIKQVQKDQQDTKIELTKMSERIAK